MRVTVIADASYCPEYKVAGYGYWIACGRGKQGGGGAIKTPVLNNIVAEMMAIANSLWHGLKEGLIAEGDEVLLQTDCIPAIEAFEGERKRLVSEERSVVNTLKDMQTRFSLQFEFRHVKGHSGRKEARFVTNKLCDKRAKQAMREARDLVRIDIIKGSLQ